MRGSRGRPGHLGLSKTFVVTQQPAAGLVAVLALNQLPTPLSSLSHLDNLLQLLLADLGLGQDEVSAVADLLGLLQLLNLGVPGGDKGSVGVSAVGLLVFVAPRLLALLVFDSVSLSLLELSERLADGSVVVARLFVRRVVEARSGLLVERNVGVVLVEITTFRISLALREGKGGEGRQGDSRPWRSSCSSAWPCS